MVKKWDKWWLIWNDDALAIRDHIINGLCNGQKSFTIREISDTTSTKKEIVGARLVAWRNLFFRKIWPSGLFKGTYSPTYDDWDRAINDTLRQTREDAKNHMGGRGVIPLIPTGRFSPHYIVPTKTDKDEYNRARIEHWFHSGITIADEMEDGQEMFVLTDSRPKVVIDHVKLLESVVSNGPALKCPLCQTFQKSANNFCEECGFPRPSEGWPTF